jgi:hypothetical protein
MNETIRRDSPSKIPRTFVFDKEINEDDYHQFIDPEEYYHEDFDTDKNEFANYRKVTII